MFFIQFRPDDLNTYTPFLFNHFFTTSRAFLGRKWAGGSLLELCKTTESSPCLNSRILTTQAISRIFVHKNLATFLHILRAFTDQYFSSYPSFFPTFQWFDSALSFFKVSKCYHFYVITFSRAYLVFSFRLSFLMFYFLL